MGIQLCPWHPTPGSTMRSCAPLGIYRFYCMTHGRLLASTVPILYGEARCSSVTEAPTYLHHPQVPPLAWSRAVLLHAITLGRFTPLDNSHMMHYHRTQTQVDPQFYAFRWITLLLAQEFAFPDTLRIWDTILADPRGRQDCLLRICAAMVLLAKERLMRVRALLEHGTCSRGAHPPTRPGAGCACAGVLRWRREQERLARVGWGLRGVGRKGSAWLCRAQGSVVPWRRSGKQPKSAEGGWVGGLFKAKPSVASPPLTHPCTHAGRLCGHPEDATALPAPGREYPA